MTSYKEIKKCRICGQGKFETILNLGMQTVIAFPSKSKAKLPKAPLELIMCKNCTLLQLKYSFDRNKLYKQYWYESGINPAMVKALSNVVLMGSKIVRLKPNDVVVDIGSNDGTLLSNYPSYCYRVGFEPSNVGKSLGDSKSIVIKDFFNSDAYYKKLKKPAKIMSACGMFYDLDDPNSFIEGIVNCLDKEGIFMIQMNYLGLMVKNKTYDDICHEHREFYSLKALEYLLDKHDLKIIDLGLNDVNGGSIRVYIKHNSSKLSVKGGALRVQKLRAWERRMRLDKLSTYKKFRKDILTNKSNMINFINKQVKNGKKIYLAAASTRGLTQMQFLGLTNKQTPYAIEKNPRKWGLYYADTKVKIISEQKLPENKKADYLYVLPYHFLSGIKKQDKSNYLKKGGKLIVAIPKFKVF